MTEFETIVVGNGLIGSAAGRYLSQLGEHVAIIGQAEPTDDTTHDGVFASHYDQRRLTHVTGRGGPWTIVKRNAVADYRALEAQSGMAFYDPVGFIMTLPAQMRERPNSPHQTAIQHGIPHRFYLAGDRSWCDKFPDYTFPDSHAILYEPDPAGTIDPRAMRQAQNVVAKANGATIINALVTNIRKQQGIITVSTLGGDSYRARKVLLATGAFTNCYDLLPRKLALIPKTEVIILGEVSESDAKHLSRLPTLNYNLDDPQIEEGYLTPAARHANGRYYVKFGANSLLDQFTDELAQIQRWFREGDSDALLPAMRRALTEIMPTTNFLSFQTKRCIITRTASTYPMIDQVAEGLFVAVGGNGGSAQCAGEWGKISAELIHSNHWSSIIPRTILQARFKGE